MFTSKAYANRSNCFRAAKQAIEKTGGASTLADVKVTLIAEGYIYTIANMADDSAELGEAEPAEPAAVEAVPAVEGAPAVETVTLVDLDDNTWASVPAEEAAAAAAKISVENGLVILATKDDGEVTSTTGTEVEPEEEAAAVEPSEVLLCIPFAMDTAVMWAAKLSKLMKVQVTIRDGVTFEVKQVVESRKLKTARAKVEGSGGPRVGGAGGKLAALLSQPGGATATQLQRAAGWNTKPSSFYLRKIAAKAGVSLVIGKSGKEPTYGFSERLAA